MDGTWKYHPHFVDQAGLKLRDPPKVSSRTAKATQRNPVSKKKQKNQNKQKDLFLLLSFSKQSFLVCVGGNIRKTFFIIASIHN